MTNTLLPAVEINPASPADSCVIWLHGLAADGHDFEPVVPYLGLPKSLALRFVFPHAPKRAVTINQGYVMPAWYDILEMAIDRKVDHAGISESVAQIHAWIEHEIANKIAPERIILAGFSQGGVVALEAALSFRTRLCGVIALSTYIADRNVIKHGDLPIFLGHGWSDPVVPFILGQQAKETLETRGYRVEWHQYPMDHSVSMDEIRDIGRWISGRLG